MEASDQFLSTRLYCVTIQKAVITAMRF